MIKIERCYKNINIKLEAIFVGDDLCAVVTGGDKPHVGAISVYSKEEGIKILNKLNMDVNIRGEKLTLQDFANLANILNDM